MENWRKKFNLQSFFRRSIVCVLFRETFARGSMPLWILEKRNKSTSRILRNYHGLMRNQSLPMLSLLETFVCISVAIYFLKFLELFLRVSWERSIYKEENNYSLWFVFIEEQLEQLSTTTWKTIDDINISVYKNTPINSTKTKQSRTRFQYE